MNNGINIKANGEDHSLNREDVEGLLLEAGSTDKLNLSNRNLRGIDFSNFDLTRANLSGANLSGANLSGANLLWVNLLGANLQGANLREANLSRTQLSRANLSLVDLSGTNLSTTYLSRVLLREANLSGANLSRTHLSEVNLSGANLSGAILNGADLSGADLSGADLNRAQLNGAYMRGEGIPEHLKRQLRERGVKVLDDGEVGVAVSSPFVHIRITEEPLTVYNVTTAFSFLTEFAIKCWLIAKHRFGDLKEYTQIHDGRFAEEAHLVIRKIAFGPHFNMDWKVDTNTPNVAKALIAAFDGINQVRKRLENQEEQQEIQNTAQKDDYGNRLALLEREQRELEIAAEVIAILQPTADEETSAILIQMILPDLLQFYKSKGLELTFSKSSVPDLP